MPCPEQHRPPLGPLTTPSAVTTVKAQQKMEIVMRRWFSCTITALLLCAAASPLEVAASPIKSTSAPIILEVSGKITPALDGVLRFDREMLEALGMKTLKTTTAWTTGVATFDGVLMRDLLEAVGADGDTLVATALNDYVISIPLDELRQYPVMLALKMDGDYLTIRDKGPLWIVYPRDQNAHFQTPSTDKRWIWQLSRISIE
jgi:hypothetical protein